MEEYKLQNHFKENLIGLPIWTLDVTLSDFIKGQLMIDLELNTGLSNLYSYVRNNLEVFVNMDITSDGGFIDLLKKLNIELLDNDQLCLVWDVNKQIDIVNVSTLKTYWDSIWYGESDEALIFYIPFKILIFISDWGDVGLITFKKIENKL